MTGPKRAAAGARTPADDKRNRHRDSIDLTIVIRDASRGWS